MAIGITENTGLDQFLADLRKLRQRAGQPSLRVMSRTAHYSHTALSGVLSGGRLPSLDLTLAFVRACGGDESEWRARWGRVRNQLDAADGMATAPSPTEPSSTAGSRRRWLVTAGTASMVAAAVAVRRRRHHS
jgi:hypothetical protein